MTPDRAEFWLVWIARFGIGLAILFILAVVLGVLRQVWCIGRSIRMTHHSTALKPGGNDGHRDL
ncbi:MAG: hypothetical protein IT432_04135 [Phycisphaerales bacterium]|nr:hypothetical protein [Phycisphaerales bacterium]